MDPTRDLLHGGCSGDDNSERAKLFDLEEGDSDGDDSTFDPEKLGKPSPAKKAKQELNRKGRQDRREKAKQCFEQLHERTKVVMMNVAFDPKILNPTLQNLFNDLEDAGISQNPENWSYVKVVGPNGGKFTKDEVKYVEKNPPNQNVRGPDRLVSPCAKG